MLEVDVKRKRIALTMRLSDSAPAPGTAPQQRGDREDRKRMGQQQQRQERAAAPIGGAMAAAFAKLKK